MVGTKRPLTQKQIWAVQFFLDREERLRDRVLFDLALDANLRGCDLVKIKIGNIVSGAEIKNRSIVIPQKTGRPVQFELTAGVRASLLAWLEGRGGAIDDYAFPSRVDHMGHLARGNMRASSMSGSPPSTCEALDMGRTPFGARRR